MHGLKHRLKRKLECIEAYGGKCLCCGEEETVFLTLDHVDNNGAEHRKTLGTAKSGINLYNYLKKNNFPKGFQVLCFNCNWAKSQVGGCPHSKGYKHPLDGFQLKYNIKIHGTIECYTKNHCRCGDCLKAKEQADG